MRYKTGTDRKQIALLPVTLDDYVPEDHICRVIEAFTGQIDKKLFNTSVAAVK